MNVKTGAEAAVCRFVDGDSIAVIGDNRKMIVFALEELPEMARGQGNYLQRYKDGGLLDATTFTWKDGVKDENNRAWTSAELKDWQGARAQAAGWSRAAGEEREIRLESA